MISLRKRCAACSAEIDYSSYKVSSELIEILTNEPKMIFDVLENPYFAYELSNDLIEIYYLSTPETTYLKVASYLLSITSNMKILEYGSEFILEIESLQKDIMEDVNKEPTNLKNLSKEFASGMVELCNRLIEDYDCYLKKLGITDRNYEEIQAHLQRNIFDKKLFEKSKYVF